MKSIIVVFDPNAKKLNLDEINTKDVEFGTDPNYKPSGVEPKLSEMAGAISPFVVINGMKFAYDNIEYFELGMEEFLPSVIVIVKAKSGMFASKAFPKDGDVISVYVKSENKDFREIRQDFRITDVSGPPSDDQYGQVGTFTIYGTLNLPDLFVDKFKSFAGKSSMDTLQDIAKELGLGFATNETATDDLMTRICPGIDYNEFIQNDVASSAYKDDKSFFNVFIDHHYYLNFVQVNDMIVLDNDLDEVRVHNIMSSNYMPNDSAEVKSTMSNFFLSNAKIKKGTADFITGFAPVNNSIISMVNGNRTYLQYYDKDNKKFEQYYIETMNTDGSDDMIILKGRMNEDHKKQTRFITVNHQFNSNVHKNYIHAKLQNKYNLDELNKLYLVVNLAGINPTVCRGMIIPIVLVTSAGSEVQRVANQDYPVSNGSDGITLDKFLTGFYVARGMKYVYSSGRSITSYMQIVCVRREYQIPVNN